MSDTSRCTACAAHAALANGLASVRAARAAWLVQFDPEALHDARVALRRLRTALELYEGLVRLPPAVTAKQVRRLSRCLASLRDLDVALQQATLLAGSETELTLRERLEQARERNRTEVAAALHGRRARRWQRALQRWLHGPAFSEVAMADAPGTIGARIAELWPAIEASPAWEAQIPALSTASPDALDALHELRRRLRVGRYLLEFGQGAGISEAGSSLEELQKLQAGLGALQDLRVLRDALVREAGPLWPAAARMVDTALDTAWSERWQQWKDLSAALHAPTPSPATSRLTLISGSSG